MARRSAGRIVRRKDSLGRTYFFERETGRRVSRRAWVLDKERVRAGEPQETPTPKGGPFRGGGRGGGGGGGGGGGDWPEPFPHRDVTPPFPPDVTELGVPDWEDFEWDAFEVSDEEDYEAAE